ncbi:MAG: HAD family hydrolase [Elusimicrobia bacterium]|nr:HAD family hydrolase [Elusimicrobiota bacterium]
MALTVRAVLFDLDDTLFPTAASHAAGITEAWKALRRVRPLGRAAFDRLYASSRADVKARLGDAPAARNRLLYFKRLVERLLGRAAPGLTLAMGRAYERSFARADTAGLGRLLASLARRYKLGIVTNQECGLQLEKLRLIDPDGRLLPVVVTSDEMGVEKPHPRIFLEACRRLGCKPAQTLVVGDSWSMDVLGARRAGLQAAFFLPRGTPPRDSVPRLRRLSDLPALLGAEGGRP